MQPYLLDQTPAVLSVGTRCVDQGYGKPILVRPDDKVVQLKIEGHVPVLDDTCKVLTEEQFQKDKHLKKLFAMPTSQSSSKAKHDDAEDDDQLDEWTMPSRNISEVARLRIFWPKLPALSINIHIPEKPILQDVPTGTNDGSTGSSKRWSETY